MSGNLAIAAVSAVMKYALQNPAPANSIAALVPDLRMSAIAPHQVANDRPTLNIFFHRAAVNPGWAQNGLPARNSAGERVANPYLALDLYYLITAHGIRDFLGEILLGYAMHVLHETPTLPRATIRAALTSSSLVTTDTPANILAAFAAAELADQIEGIRISPHYPSPDELSNVWSPLNVGYVPTAYYKVTAVLIESKRSTRSAPPVRAVNLYSLPFKAPRITDAVPAADANAPILPSTRIALRGQALRGDDTRVTVGGVELSGNALVVSDDRVEFDLPASLEAGVVGVQVSHMLALGDPPVPHQGIESNIAAFVLQPRIQRNGANYVITILPASGSTPRRLQIGLIPNVPNNARASVMLNEVGAPSTRPAFSFSFEAERRAPTDPPSAQLTFPIPGVGTGTYLVRVRVSGAESPLDYTAGTGYSGPTVTLP